jgi:hypothetical protein
MHCQIDLLVFDRLFVSRIISIKFDPLGPSGLPSIKFNLVLDHLSMNGVGGEVSLRLYWDV